jgi:hypothetical protein
MIPGGKTAKLVRVPDPYHGDFVPGEPATKLKFIRESPVILVSGAMTTRA